MIETTALRWNGGCLAALIFLTLLAGCGDKVGPGTAEVKRQAITGTTVTVMQLSKISDDYETSGTVRAKVTSWCISFAVATRAAVVAAGPAGAARPVSRDAAGGASGLNDRSTGATSSGFRPRIAKTTPASAINRKAAPTGSGFKTRRFDRRGNAG